MYFTAEQSLRATQHDRRTPEISIIAHTPTCEAVARRDNISILLRNCVQKPKKTLRCSRTCRGGTEDERRGWRSHGFLSELQKLGTSRSTGGTIAVSSEDGSEISRRTSKDPTGMLLWLLREACRRAKSAQGPVIAAGRWCAERNGEWNDNELALKVGGIHHGRTRDATVSCATKCLLNRGAKA